MNTVGKKIRKLRKQMGLTQSRLSMMSEVSQSNLSKIENDTKTITLDDYRKLMFSLGFTLSLTKLPKSIDQVNR